MPHVIPDGNVIRRLRKAVGLTQKELARRAGLSQSLISRIERGNIDPRLSTVRKIMRVIEGLTVKGKVTAEQIMHKPVITVKANQPVKVAVELMEKYDISQLPVVDEEGRPIGALQESTLINYLIRERNFRRFSEKCIRNIMENPFPQVASNTNIQELLYIFSRGVPAVLVVKDGKISGIITKIDLITTILRKQM